MASRIVVLRPSVADDLEKQVKYLDENANREVADRYVAAIESACDQLADMPGMGAPRGYLNSRLQGLRMWPVPGFTRYLIFYRFTGEVVEVIRVLHGSQDIERILGDEE
jgi:toxin ParE1/3/4